MAHAVSVGYVYAMGRLPATGVRQLANSAAQLRLYSFKAQHCREDGIVPDAPRAVPARLDAASQGHSPPATTTVKSRLRF